MPTTSSWDYQSILCLVKSSIRNCCGNWEKFVDNDFLIAVWSGIIQGCKQDDDVREVQDETETFPNFLETETRQRPSISGLKPRPRLRRSKPRHFSRRYMQAHCMWLKTNTTMTVSIHALILQQLEQTSQKFLILGLLGISLTSNFNNQIVLNWCQKRWNCE